MYVEDPIRREFERLKNGEKSIQSFLDDKESEYQTLDFKNPDLSKPDEVKNAFSKTATAMANTGGGLIVWGVDCPSSRNNRADTVTACPGYHDPNKLLEKLKSLDGLISDPPLFGLIHEVIQEKYVITLVPAGLQRPFQSIQKKGMYYMRSGGNSVEMPHRMVEDAILSRKSPMFNCLVRLIARVQKSGDSTIYARLNFEVINMSPVTAHNPIVFILCNRNLFSYTGASGKPKLGQFEFFQSNLEYSLGDVIHPYNREQISANLVLSKDKYKPLDVFVVKLLVFCNDTAQHFQIRLRPDFEQNEDDIQFGMSYTGELSTVHINDTEAEMPEAPLHLVDKGQFLLRTII